MEKFDVIVVGGGPAGMMAAGHAAEYGRRVLLVEKNRNLGRKLELTGGGRCNITNAEFDTRTLLSFFGDASKFLFSPFSRFAVRDTFDFFESRNLPLIIEERKRAFPKTERATDVTRVLTDYMREYDVDIRFGVEVKRLLSADGEMTGIETNQGTFEAESIILTTGGSAYKETGSTGDGFGWLKELGHTVHAPSPNIVPLRVKDAWVKELSGTAIDPMKIVFTAADGAKVHRTGKLLFTHFGLSGPLILNSALEVKALLKQGPVRATIDLYPTDDPRQLDRHILDVFDQNKNKIVRNVAKQLMPAGMSKVLAVHLSEELLEKKVNVVTLEERKTLIQMLKGLPLTVTGTMGYDWAVVSDGGVDLKDIDTRTMRSRLIPNLYVAGDLLHVSRPSGGYSLQLCWTTGFVAGENA